uniref:Uncharacterized protein n=1 Tax=Rhizophora mucronata TaxID=61149 RepID=A0A2P2MY74_RHIMU
MVFSLMIYEKNLFLYVRCI